MPRAIGLPAACYEDISRRYVERGRELRCFGAVFFRLVRWCAEPGKGNPAGVVLSAQGMSDSDMQALAARTGFPDTAFVSDSTEADFRIRYFSPRREVELCGHATIAASFPDVLTGMPGASIHRFCLQTESPGVDMHCPSFLVAQLRDAERSRHGNRIGRASWRVLVWAERNGASYAVRIAGTTCFVDQRLV
jgi:hypothetical protein